MDNYTIHKYNQAKYAVFPVYYKQYNQSYKLPVIMSYDDFIRIKPLRKNWIYSSNGLIYCYHTLNNLTKKVYLHELVLLLNNRNNNQNSNIIHINKMGLDNRRENLAYDIYDKEYGKNLNKKQRTLKLPYNSNIDKDKIPTFIWYMKGDETHGDRFIVKINDYTWKTTSSKQVSLKYKLEEAKMYMRYLLKNNPNLLNEISMNGDLNRQGRYLLKSYFDIVYDAMYTDINKIKSPYNTLELLQPDYKNLTDEEIIELTKLKEHLSNSI